MKAKIVKLNVQIYYYLYYFIAIIILLYYFAISSFIITDESMIWCQQCQVLIDTIP